jgi:DhnA family fructose-bisphosphate aldolase class Ia
LGAVTESLNSITSRAGSTGQTRMLKQLSTVSRRCHALQMRYMLAADKCGTADNICRLPAHHNRTPTMFSLNSAQ